MSRMSAFGLLLSLSLPLGSHAALAQASESETAIVVTGRSLVDTGRSLAACIAAECPPDQDIGATLTHAENQFVAGEYEAAWLTLRASFSRSRKHAKAHPQLVSELSRANANVASHLGRDADYRYFTREILRSLKDGTDKIDTRHLTARMELAKMELRVSGYEQARQELQELERDAIEANRPDYAAYARLRRAWLAYLNKEPIANMKAIETLAASNEPRMKSVADGAKIFLSTLARNRGDEAQAEALIAQVGATSNTPTLLSAPAWSLVEEAAHRFEDRWIDVAFNVEADGRVSNVELLRQSGDPSWARDLLTSIPKRIYTRSTSPDNVSYRVERYTYTARRGTETGSRIARRVAGTGDNWPDSNTPARVEYIDLTPAARSAEARSGPKAAPTPSI